MPVGRVGSRLARPTKRRSAQGGVGWPGDSAPVGSGESSAGLATVRRWAEWEVGGSATKRRSAQGGSRGARRGRATPGALPTQPPQAPLAHSPRNVQFEIIDTDGSAPDAP